MTGIILTSVLVIAALTAAFAVGRRIKRRRAAAVRAPAGTGPLSDRVSYSPVSTADQGSSSWFAAMLAGISDSGSHRSTDSGSQYGGSGSHHSSHDSGSGHSSYDSGSSFSGGSDGGSW